MLADLLNSFTVVFPQEICNIARANISHHTLNVWWEMMSALEVYLYTTMRYIN